MNAPAFWGLFSLFFLLLLFNGCLWSAIMHFALVYVVVLSNNVVHCLFVFEATKLKVHEVLTHELSVIFYFQQFGTCACCQLPVAIVKYLIAGSILYQ